MNSNIIAGIVIISFIIFCFLAIADVLRQKQKNKKYIGPHQFNNIHGLGVLRGEQPAQLICGKCSTCKCNSTDNGGGSD